MRGAAKLAAGWLAAGLGIFGLTRFTIQEEYREQFAYASWLAGAEALDTVTYADKRIVYKVPVALDTTDNGDTIYVPDVSALPAGAQYVVRMKGNGDSALIITYDTAAASPTDSTTVEAIYTAWGLGTPAAYSINVPGQPTQFAITDTTTALWHANFEAYDSSKQVSDDNYTSLSSYPTSGKFWRSDMKPYPNCHPTYWNGAECNWYIDTTQSWSTYSRSMQYRHIYADTLVADGSWDSLDPDQSVSSTLGYEIPDPIGNVSQLWVEFVFKTTPGLSGCGFTQPCDYKFALFGVSGEDSISGFKDHGRFLLKGFGTDGESVTDQDTMYDGQLDVSVSAVVSEDGTVRNFDTSESLKNAGICPSSTIITYNEAQLNDGEWHQIRFYMKRSTTESLDTAVNSFDARYVVWIDGVRMRDSDSLVSLGGCKNFGTFSIYDTINGITRIERAWFTANKDHGSRIQLNNGASYPINEHVWFQYFSLFTSDPGWLKWGD